jgi:hypothetical protein
MRQHNPRAGMVGLPLLEAPALRPDVAQHLGTFLRRRPAPAAEGRLLYLPRLGVTVLPHAPNPVAAGGGWVCTVAGATGADQLPVGVLLLSDVEVETAIGTVNSAAPLDGVTTAEYAAIWSLRVHEWSGGGPTLRLARELLELGGADLGVASALQPTVTISPDAARTLARSTHTLTRTLPRQVSQLVSAGFLVDLTPSPGSGTLVYALTVPPMGWWKAPPRRLDDS